MLAGCRGPAEVQLHPGAQAEPDSGSVHLFYLSPCCRGVHHQTWVPHTHTQTQPGFSSGPELITALCLHSSEKQPRAHVQLQVSARAPLQTSNSVYLWVGFWVFSCDKKIPFRKGCFILLFKKLLKTTSNFY